MLFKWSVKQILQLFALVSLYVRDNHFVLNKRRSLLLYKHKGLGDHKAIQVTWTKVSFFMKLFCLTPLTSSPYQERPLPPSVAKKPPKGPHHHPPLVRDRSLESSEKQRQEARKRLMAAKRAASVRQNSATESADSIEIYIPEAQTRLWGCNWGCSDTQETSSTPQYSIWVQTIIHTFNTQRSNLVLENHILEVQTNIIMFPKWLLHRDTAILQY